MFQRYLFHLLSLCFLLVFVTDALRCQDWSEFDTGHLRWTRQAPGIWRTVAGSPDDIDLLDAAGIEPNYQALAQMDSVEFPLDTARIGALQYDNNLNLRFPLTEGEQIYGLGLQFKSINRREKIYRLHVDHYGGQDNGRTHAPVPFYVSSKGYGVLINTARYITIYVGTTVRADTPNPPPVRDRNTDPDWTARPRSDVIEVLVPAEGTEILIFGGPSPLKVVQRYNSYNGGGCLPPKWGLGFTYRTHRLYTAEDVLQEVETFREKAFPLDFVGLEPGWMSASYPCTYQWDEHRFPHPEQFVKSLLTQHVRTNLWMNPYVSPEASLYTQLKPYAGSHTVWNGIVPDYSLGEPRTMFLDSYEKHQLDIGVAGVKIDECDGYDRWLWPDVATFPSGLTGEQVRQTYGLLLQRMITNLYMHHNRRTYGLVRASNAGASSLPFVLYNDYYSHADFITALCNSGFSGILWTPEVRSSETGEEWLRRMQSVCFSPMAMINAWSSGTKPWSFPEVYPAVQHVAELRMRLLPYIYSAFARYHFEGIPPIRAMALLENFDPESIRTQQRFPKNLQSSFDDVLEDVKDQYMFGDDLLIAPMFAGQETRPVILPGGPWYDFYTGEYAGENEVIEVSPGLERIPLFVRDGGIIPLIPARLHMPETGEVLPLEIRHYGTSEGEFLLYDDDGETYDYQDGEYSWTRLQVSRTPDGQFRGEVNRLDDRIFQYRDPRWVFMTE